MRQSSKQNGGTQSMKERNKEVKHAVEYTTKGLLNNIFANNPKEKKGVVINDNPNVERKMVPQIQPRRKKINRQQKNVVAYQGFGNEDEEPTIKENVEENQTLEEGIKEKDLLLEKLLTDKDHALDAIEKANEQNTLAMQHQGDKTISLLQNMLREERSSFEELTQKLQDEKEKTIQQIEQSSNEKVESMERQFQQATNTLQKTMHDDRTAFMNNTQKSIEEKQISGQMLQSALERNNESLNSTLKVFLNKQFEDYVQDKNETITNMQSQIEMLNQQLRKTSEEKLTGSFVNYHLEHAKRFDNTLQLIATLEHRRNANIKGIEASLQSAVLNSINERMITIHQTILQQTERLTSDIGKMNLNVNFLQNIETSMKRQIANIASFSNQLDSFDIESSQSKLASMQQKINDLNSALDMKFLQITNQMDKTMSVFMNSVMTKITKINDTLSQNGAMVDETLLKTRQVFPMINRGETPATPRRNGNVLSITDGGGDGGGDGIGDGRVYQRRVPTMTGPAQNRPQTQRKTSVFDVDDFNNVDE